MLTTLIIVYGILGIALTIKWYLMNKKLSASNSDNSSSKGLLGIKSDEQFREQYGDKFPF